MSDNGRFVGFENIGLSYSHKGERLTVIKNLSMELKQGEFSALIGPSGCGKSTLFNALAGLVPLDAGSIFLEGRQVAHLRGRISYMQQKDLLLPWRDVLGNAVLGMETGGVPKKEAQKQARELLGEFGLDGFEKSYPRELSGGMRQRVALVRTMLCQKDVWLLDEPFGALDAITRRDMHMWLLKVWEKVRATVILVTHDVDEALMLADRIHVLSPRPASISMTETLDMPRPRRITRPEISEIKERLLTALENGQGGGT